MTDPTGETLASHRTDLAAHRTTLAATRTALANERTLLAYTRTALALLAGAGALIALADAPWAHALGWASVPLAVGVLGVGVARFRACRRQIGVSGVSGQGR